jgi:hypothetical protein
MKVVLIISMMLLTSCHMVNKYFGLQDDNFIEETAELALQVETGINVDLSPETPE